jgi:hypothetical protein
MVLVKDVRVCVLECLYRFLKVFVCRVFPL